ncbi:hypothetical protein [Sphingobacterium sp. T2]|uniref:hypothetical protein n=1 Tax=Sphingobacterium sp. T2 TaxID=1590596 RepID=UPI00057BBCA7|nr:hypothetical protein [Sphingobacterium sp. T2]
MEVDFADGKKIKFNLLTDTIKVKEVKAVQKNNGVLLGYFSLKTQFPHSEYPLSYRSQWLYTTFLQHPSIL